MRFLGWLSVTFLVALVLGTTVALAIVPDGWDIVNAYPSPEHHAGVARLDVPFPDGIEWDHRGDFDGDGTDDVLEVESYSMQRLFGRWTGGLLRLRSGRTKELLFAHALPTPIDTAVWCGDRDGNGTDDVLVEDETWKVFGRVDPR